MMSVLDLARTIHMTIRSCVVADSPMGFIGRNKVVQLEHISRDIHISHQRTNYSSTAGMMDVHSLRDFYIPRPPSGGIESQ